MGPNHGPFLGGQFIRLVEDLLGDTDFSHVMKESGHAQMGQLLLGNADPLAQGNGIDGHIDAMVKRVIVVVLDIGQPQEGRLVLHDGVDRVLHEVLGLADVDEFLRPDALRHLPHQVYGLGVNVLRLALLPLRVDEKIFIPQIVQFSHGDAVDPPEVELTIHVEVVALIAFIQLG